MLDFRTVILTLLPYIDGSNLVAAADSIVALPLPTPERPVITNPLGGTLDWSRFDGGSNTFCWDYDQNTLVGIALHNDTVLANARLKKILAIKELRQIAKCGLKAAKDAVEDYRVFDAAPSHIDPWDEPPF